MTPLEVGFFFPPPGYISSSYKSKIEAVLDVILPLLFIYLSDREIESFFIAIPCSRKAIAKFYKEEEKRKVDLILKRLLIEDFTMELGKLSICELREADHLFARCWYIWQLMTDALHACSGYLTGIRVHPELRKCVEEDGMDPLNYTTRGQCTVVLCITMKKRADEYLDFTGKDTAKFYQYFKMATQPQYHLPHIKNTKYTFCMHIQTRMGLQLEKLIQEFKTSDAWTQCWGGVREEEEIVTFDVYTTLSDYGKQVPYPTEYLTTKRRKIVDLKIMTKTKMEEIHKIDFLFGREEEGTRFRNEERKKLCKACQTMSDAHTIQTSTAVGIVAQENPDNYGKWDKSSPFAATTSGQNSSVSIQETPDTLDDYDNYGTWSGQNSLVSVFNHTCVVPMTPPFFNPQGKRKSGQKRCNWKKCKNI